MLSFRQMKTLQKFASVHANVHNHFNSERHLIDRPTYKLRHSARAAERSSLMAWSFALKDRVLTIGDLCALV